MNTLIKKIIVGAAGLVLAAAPLAASAQSSHDRGNDRGSYRDNRGYDNRGQAPRDRDDRGRWADQRPVYTAPYVNGYFGLAPGGFQGYYNNGGWYQHRRWDAGIWIYF